MHDLLTRPTVILKLMWPHSHCVYHPLGLLVYTSNSARIPQAESFSRDTRVSPPFYSAVPPPSGCTSATRPASSSTPLGLLAPARLRFISASWRFFASRLSSRERFAGLRGGVPCACRGLPAFAATRTTTDAAPLGLPTRGGDPRNCGGASSAAPPPTTPPLSSGSCRSRRPATAMSLMCGSGSGGVAAARTLLPLRAASPVAAAARGLGATGVRLRRAAHHPELEISSPAHTKHPG